MGPTITERVGAWAAGLRLERVPARVVERVRLQVVAAAAAAAAAVLAVALVPHGGKTAYRSAESVSVDATGEGCQALVMVGREGGLNLVVITSETEPDKADGKAGG
jgi:hypothetical protein